MWVLTPCGELKQIAGEVDEGSEGLVRLVTAAFYAPLGQANL